MFKRLPGQPELYRNTLILILGTGLGQAIPILLQPFLRRIYTPEEFGVFAVYFSMINILTVIANFRYDLAINLPKSDENGANLMMISIFINVIFHVIVFGIILIFRNDIAALVRIPPQYSKFLFILPLSTFFFCTFQAINYWLIRKKAFKVVSINKISRRGAEGLVQIGFGLMRNSAGLFWGDLAGNIANNISGFRQLKKTGFRLSFISRLNMKMMLKEYFHFPKYNLIPQLMGTIAMQFPVFIISRHFTKTDLGYFDLTQQAIIFPFSLITVAISQVLLQMVSEKRNKKQGIKKDFLGLSVILLGIGIVSVLLIEFWGPALFSFIFGSKWTLAGHYSRTLIIGYLFFLVASPMTGILIGLEKIKSLGLWNLVHLLLMIALSRIPDISFPTFLQLFVGLEIISFSFFYFLTFFAVRKYERDLIKMNPKTQNAQS
jgi:O-antigen/teichoic acid export membrane protein